MTTKDNKTKGSNHIGMTEQQGKELVNALKFLVDGMSYNDYVSFADYEAQERKGKNRAIDYGTWFLLQKAYENEDFILFCEKCEKEDA